MQTVELVYVLEPKHLLLESNKSFFMCWSHNLFFKHHQKCSRQQHFVHVECLQMNDGTWNSCWWRRLMMTAAAECLSSQWIHPADWWFSYTFGLLSKLSAALVCQTDSITAALLLWRGSVSVRSRSLGLWWRWLLLMFSRHRLAFHRAVSQRPEASYETSLQRERSTQPLSGLVWCL